MKKAWVLATLLGGICIACEEKRLEPAAPSELKTDQLSGGSQDAQDAENGEETIIPPTQVTGAYLTARVLEETTINDTAEARIGLVLYYKGQKVALDPNRYQVSLSITPGRDPAVTVSDQVSDIAGYDQLVMMSGPTTSQIRNAYQYIGIYLTIVDRSDYSSETFNSNMGAVLSSVEPKTSTSVNTSTNGTRGAAGGAGRNGASTGP